MRQMFDGGIVCVLGWEATLSHTALGVGAPCVTAPPRQAR